MTTCRAGLRETTSPFHPDVRLLWVPLGSIWLLMAGSFTLPGRASNESLETLDALGLFKAGVRGLACGALVLAILMLRRNVGRAGAPSGFAPFGVFVAWALASSLWSPLPAYSAGQAMTLLTQLLLAVALALACRDGDCTSRVLGQLSTAFLLICATLLAVHAVNPEWSGFNRASGGRGLLHPLTAAGTASLGFVLVLACRLVWGWRWTRVLLLPSLVVFPAVLFLAAGRMALGLAIVLAILLIWNMGDRRWLGALALVGSLAGIVYPLAEPGLDVARRVAGAAADYARRGESTETLQTLTGRTELWRALLASFLEAPLAGHGYFVTSSGARVYVWNAPENRGAHNLLLQVAVSTGLIGLGLFLAGLGRPVAAACRRLGSTEEGRRLRRLAAVLGVWFLGSSALNESFMGGIAPESILAFALFGLLMAHAREEETA